MLILKYPQVTKLCEKGKIQNRVYTMALWEKKKGVIRMGYMLMYQDTHQYLWKDTLMGMGDFILLYFSF